MTSEELKEGDLPQETPEKDSELGKPTTCTTSSAMKNWSTLKKVVQSQRLDNSLTSQEKDFLKMINTSKSSRALKVEFVDVVKAAVARDKLRKELKVRLSKLTTKEAQFLRNIVEDEDVTKQQLENADHVLRNDPLYRLIDEEEDTRDNESGDTNGTNVDRTPDFDVSIEVDQNEIEIFISSLGVDDQDTVSRSQTQSLSPSTYSYKTWDLIKCQTQEYAIIGVPDELVETSRVLTPSMIDSLRNFLPYATAEDNFWLKYSMSRDGASLDSLYHSIRQSSKTLFTIETVAGEVFGAYVSSPWRNQRGFYGSCEAFLWKMKESRFTPTYSIEEQAKMEGRIEVFKWSSENRNIQMSNRRKIAIGGGCPGEPSANERKENWGLGIALDDTLYQGTSSPCITFRSPNLVEHSSKGDVFEVSNLEVWSFTPCQNEKEAEQLELGRMFVLSHFDS